MKTSDIIKKIEEFAPLEYSRRYVLHASGYDNSGLLIGGAEREHSKMLVCVDVNKSDIDFAIENGIKFIFAHHPYIYGKIGEVNFKSPKGREIISIIKNDITVYSAHLNLDVACGGIDDTLSGLVSGGAEIIKTFEDLGGIGYGKVAELECPVEFLKYKNEIKETLEIQKSFNAGVAVQKIASFCGSGLSEKMFFEGVEFGVDTFISSDIPHHLMVEGRRHGVNILDIPHGESEFIAMKKIVKNMDFEGLELFFQSGKVIME